ncbi:tRNA (adenine(58)-N(1))-methyltransferase non-catalytic subunit TRM6-like isoform X1 [Artemia franciscana]|uniref:tRNA (adenine(58)-N(1))-methyltransferase non-catalytic subunit TRM6-like isoform X1 n=1 Tax=Artemia franciscana TaxID=6661 RepID=UPI0032DAF043
MLVFIFQVWELLFKMDYIKPGIYVLLRRKNLVKVIKIEEKKGSAKERQVQLGRDTIDISDVLGYKIGSIFKLVHQKGRNFKAVFTDRVSDLTDVVLEGIGSGEDNQSQWDDNTSQKLSHQEIAQLRKEGTSAADIVKQLVENNAAFELKTGFSQEKYVKKKEEKYFEYIEVLRPSIRLIAQMLYAQNPLKILNLRIDMLSQILTRANIRSGGRYLVFENSSLGLMTAAIMERVGSVGTVYQIHGGSGAPNQCIEYMNLSEVRHILKTFSFVNLKKLMNMKPCFEDTSEDSTETEQISMDDEKLRIGEKRKLEEINDLETAKKPKMSIKNWEDACSAWKEIQEMPLDGLVIVTRQPEPLVLPLLKLLAPSRSFAIFSPHIEPLTSSYSSLKSSGMALNLRLSETWMREYQVLPNRTHPEINMSGGGGYLLYGTTCIKNV